MSRTTLLVIASACLALAGPALAHEPLTSPPGGDYAPVADLVPLPDYIPGLGTLWVQPATLPAGPFLGFDRDGNQVNTIYMIPLDTLDAHQTVAPLEGTVAPVTFTELHFNAGHPGVEVPHYHIVLWHVPPETVEAME